MAARTAVDTRGCRHHPGHRPGDWVPGRDGPRRSQGRQEHSRRRRSSLGALDPGLSCAGVESRPDSRPACPSAVDSLAHVAGLPHGPGSSVSGHPRPCATRCNPQRRGPRFDGDRVKSHSGSYARPGGSAQAESVTPNSRQLVGMPLSWCSPRPRTRYQSPQPGPSRLARPGPRLARRASRCGQRRARPDRRGPRRGPHTRRCAVRLAPRYPVRVPLV